MHVSEEERVDVILDVLVVELACRRHMNGSRLKGRCNFDASAVGSPDFEVSYVRSVATHVTSPEPPPRQGLLSRDFKLVRTKDPFTRNYLVRKHTSCRNMPNLSRCSQTGSGCAT